MAKWSLEALGEFVSDQTTWPPAADLPAGRPDPLDAALERLAALGATAVANSGLFGQPGPSDFACRVEEASRRVEGHSGNG